MDAYTTTCWDGLLTVTGVVEGQEVHLTRTYRGQVQHKYLRADIHANTPDALRICVCADLTYLREALIKELR